MYEIKYRKPEEMKDSGVEWLGKIPREWEIHRIKSVLRERKENNLPIKTDFILSLTIDRGVIPYTEKGDIGNKAKEDLTAYRLAYPNDIVINSMNVIVGSVGLSKYFGAVSPVYYVLYSRNHKDSIKFFNYIFQSRVFQKSLIGYGNGIMMKETESGSLNTIRMRIPMIKLNTVFLPYPCSINQKKIANFLDIKTAQFDSIISKKEKLIEKLEEAKKSLISEVITGKVKIVDGRMVKRKPEEMKDSGVEWLGMIPVDWEVARLKYLVKINPLKSEVTNKNIECSFIPMEKIQNGIIKTDEIKKVKEVYGGYTYFKNKDIIMAKVTPCYENGNIAIATNLINGIGFGTTEINVFRPINQDLEFIFYSMQESHFMNFGVSHMTGVAGLKRVPTSYFANHKFYMPNIIEQEEIANFLNDKITDINRIINKTQTQIDKLKEAKQSLISEAVTGKIDLRDWEIIEEGGA